MIHSTILKQAPHTTVPMKISYCWILLHSSDLLNYPDHLVVGLIPKSGRKSWRQTSLVPGQNKYLLLDSFFSWFRRGVGEAPRSRKIAERRALSFYGISAERAEAEIRISVKVFPTSREQWTNSFLGRIHSDPSKQNNNKENMNFRDS